MGKTRYDKAIEVLKKYNKDYIYTADLRGLILKEIAGTEVIIVATLKMLRETGVITETKINKWKINL